MPSTEDIIAASRGIVAECCPYLSGVLFSIRPVPVERLGTFAVTKNWIMMYDPAKAVEWDTKGCSTVIFHEICHVLREHFDRLTNQRESDPLGVNCALDREINDDVIAAGFKFPIRPLMPIDINMKNGLTAEEYYRPTEHVKPTESVPGCGGDCGSCAGNAVPGESEHDGSLSEMDKKVVLIQTAQAIKDHAKTYGSVPNGLRAWADLKLQPSKIDWRRRLAALVRNSLSSITGACDFTWRKIGRRSLHSAGRSGWPLSPAYRQPVPNVAVVLDTSGSMLGESIHIALSETLGIVKAVIGETKVYATDCIVHKVSRVTKESDLDKINAGGGGTSMRPGFLAARKDGADLIVILTDGYMGMSDWPTAEECRGTRTLAVICGGQRPPDHVPFVTVD